MPDLGDLDPLAGLRTRVAVPPVEQVIRRARRRRRRRALATSAAAAVICALGVVVVVNRDDDGEMVAVGPRDTATEPLQSVLRSDTGHTFPTDPIGGEGRLACIDGQEVRVYAFANAEERQSVSDEIDLEDPSNFGAASVSWVGQPRFWVHEELLVMYAGRDDAVIATLQHALGDPIATGGGREADSDAFSCDWGVTSGEGDWAEAPPPEPDPAQIVADPSVAAPGATVAFLFPTEVERGVPYYLSRWGGDGWGDPEFLLISDGGGYEGGPAWFGQGDQWAWRDVGVVGSGPDTVVIPPDAPPGYYRACTANTGATSYCVQLRVVDGTVADDRGETDAATARSATTPGDNGAVPLPTWQGNSNGAALFVDARIEGDASLSCVWLVGSNGERYAVIWPDGYTASFEPLRIFDANGDVVWEEGELRDVAGGEVPEIGELPVGCRVGTTAYRASRPTPTAP